ncbi:MAG TPA: class I SAM-dependent methyltransferase [Ilumatobacteraceae bacterium]
MREQQLPPSDFVPAYLRAREREGRLLADELVRDLPLLPAADPLADEWHRRADSARRIVSHLANMPQPLPQSLRVLDLGCGNGWLSARMAALAHVNVIGIDINTTELEQARRVFAARPRLAFESGDLEGRGWPARAPDVVVLASSLQYVADPAGLFARLLAAYPTTGVHVLDTPIYSGAEIEAARERSREHYERIGVPQMIGYYHHHDWDIFAGFPHRVLFDPAAPHNRVARVVLRRRTTPFPWIEVTG